MANSAGGHAPFPPAARAGIKLTAYRAQTSGCREADLHNFAHFKQVQTSGYSGRGNLTRKGESEKLAIKSDK